MYDIEGSRVDNDIMKDMIVKDNDECKDNIYLQKIYYML